LFEPDSRPAFAQDGEDLLLWRLFKRQDLGFYVDVGAHHPKRFSTTYLFYRRGWRGINIDAMPGSMRQFHKIRPRDVNLEIAIARTAGTLTYHMFNHSALNTFDPNLADERTQIEGYNLVDTKSIVAQPLADVLAAYLPAAQTIDFMSVDVEGLDLEVLESNDWAKFRPRYLVVERPRAGECEDDSDPITDFLAKQGYCPFAGTILTRFYRERQTT
jgi:FkbM family methyltransferase